MDISYSSFSMFCNCQKKYYWRHIEHLSPITRLPSLFLGKTLHEGFDLFYKGESDTGVFDYIDKTLSNEVDRQEGGDKEGFIIARYTALGMWHNYPYKNLNEYSSINSEEDFRVELCDDVYFVGKVDGRLIFSNKWWVRELKTSSLPLSQFQGRCQISAQGTGYVYGLTKKGYDIKGILYEYIKKPMLRKGTNESVHDFGKRLMFDYRVRPKLYYDRYLSYRSPVDVQHFVSDVTNICHDIIEKTKTGNFYRNHEQCWSFNSECPYAKICFVEKPDSLILSLYFTKGGKK